MEARRPAADYDARIIERTAEVEKHRALLEAAIENISAGVVIMTSDGVPLYANTEALRILGGDSIDDFGPDTWRDVEAFGLDGRRLPPEEWPVSRTLATGEIVRSETYEVLIDGRHVILETSTAPIVTPAGEETGALAVLRDVTARERTERAERDFVTNAAHELQSPLAAIVSAIEVLQAGAKDGPQRDVFLGHIERESDRLARLVRALLILARTQIGLETPRDELVEVRALLEEIGATLRLATSVRLEIDCPSELAMLTNRELVEQAIMNLAENAAKHTKTGRVGLSARQLPEGVAEIVVSDSGSGIVAAERLRVFERFYRGDPDAASGFGLGLAIVRAVADALDAELVLDSTVGGGTRVRLRIPGAASMVGR